jgi:hypothetical protein
MALSDTLAPGDYEYHLTAQQGQFSSMSCFDLMRLIYIYMYIYNVDETDIFIVDGTDVCMYTCDIILFIFSSSAQTTSSIFVRKFFKCRHLCMKNALIIMLIIV